MSVDAVRGHPRVTGVAEDPEEVARAGDFAAGLARFLVGEPLRELPALTRVVAGIARRDLEDPRRLCEGRPLLAVEAAARWTEALWPMLRTPLAELEAPPPPEEGEGEGASEGGGEPGDEEGEGSGAGDGEGASPAAGPGGGEEGAEDGADGASGLAAALEEGGEAAAAAAVVGAVEAATARRTLERYLPGIGWSIAAGHLDQRLLSDLPRTASLLARSDTLRRLADALGRVEGAARRGPDQGGSEEVVGVHIGGDVRTALPSELALLGDPELEDLFYQRLVEHRLVSLELAGAGLDGVATGEKRGPVIACVDTSGSMEGAPEAAARALVLAICRRVLPQGRTVHLLLFGGPEEKTELRVRRGPAGLDALLDFLAMAFRTGTDLDTPLRRAVELTDESPLRKADALVITDGLCRVGDPTAKLVRGAREARGMRLWTVLMGPVTPRSLVDLSDHTWRVDPEAPEAGAQVIKAVSAPS